MASGAVDLFIADPSLEGLLKLTKVDLLAVAANYGITTTKQSLKPVIVATISQHLLAQGVVASQEEEDKDEEGLERVEVPPGSSPIRPEGGVGVESRVPLTLPKFQPSPEESGRSVETARLRLRVARLEADLRDKAERRQQEYELELRKLDIKRLEVETSKEIRKMEIQAETEVKIQIRQLELAAGVSSSPPVGREGPFDVGRNIAIVPPFRESEVDSYFSAFERVAGALHWPKEVWPLLLQCKLTGKAQEVVASLSLEESGQYDLVKAAVLRAYELVPEAYRQRFRNHRKSSNKTFVEFARDKGSLFDRWCAASKASTYATLRELTLLEDFKSHLPDDIVVHLNEQKVATMAHAAVMADEYALTHKTVFYPSTPTHGPRPSNSQAVRTSSSPAAQPFTRGPSKAERECFYCRLPGHLIADCPTLKAKPKGPLSPSLSKGVGFVGPKKPSVVYSPFLSKGWVSLCDEASQQPITILRDTGAAQSIIVSTSLPWSEKSYCGSHVLLTGIELGTISVPLHWVYLSSSIVSGRVRVGVVPRLPVDGVSFLLGNDIAGGRVVPVPEVVDNPDPAYTGTETDRSVFPACVVTRAQERTMKNEVGQGEVRPIARKVEAIESFPVPITRRQLRQFVGMVGYYRTFCKNFSTVMAPLTSLLSPKVQYAWSAECQQAFESAKALLCASPVLAAPDSSKPFKLEVDASSMGAGAVLIQEDDKGIDRPVCYYSKKFTPCQTRYSTVEQETLALLLALQFFEVYVGSSALPVTVYTDHNPLVFLGRMYNSNRRLMRWALIVQGYNLTIQHIKGSDNVVADALSRVW
uniref:CCHC-type domain-containing protein n=1 Tax=Gasterosteus aculeatus aculeatus TaxID=481459 RepID=A0AAQ4R8V1_GASAC